MIDTVLMKIMRSHANKTTNAKLWITALLMTCLSSGVSKATPIVDNFFENGGTTLFTLWAGEWITPEEVVHLDTTLCNIASRSYWTNITHSIPFQDALVIRKQEFSFQDFSALLNRFGRLKGVIFPSAESFRRVLKDPGFTEMSFPYWDHLDLKEYAFTDHELLNIIQRCPNLKKLELSGHCKLTSAVFPSIKLENLERLTLIDNKNMADESLKKLFGRCPNLRNLILGSNTTLTGGFLSSMHAEKLEGLTIEGCEKVTKQHLKELLKGCTNLKNLTLHGNRTLTGEFLSSMHAEKLEGLDIHWCVNVTEQHLKELLARCPNLKKLTLGGNRTLTGEFLSSMQPENLEELTIQSCGMVEEQHLKKLLGRCPNLKKLTLHGNRTLTGESHGNTTLTGESLSSMQSKKLEELAIHWCGKITEQHLTELLARCPNLKKLTLEENDTITGEFFSSMQSKKLEELIIKRCKALSEQRLTELLGRYPNLIIITD